MYISNQITKPIIRLSIKFRDVFKLGHISDEYQHSTMEEVLWRFPHIGEQTFKKLSNINLAKWKTVSKTWYHFITNEKFYKQ